MSDKRTLTTSERFEILKTELALIQATLDKYDDLIFRNRNFFITLWIASIGLAFTIKSTDVIFLAMLLSVVYWFLEGMMRHQYWYKYVERYRFLRNSLNSDEVDLSDISVYDLTNERHRESENKYLKIRKCFFKLEPSVTFMIMGISALIIWGLFHWHVLHFNFLNQVIIDR